MYPSTSTTAPTTTASTPCRAFLWLTACLFLACVSATNSEATQLRSRDLQEGRIINGNDADRGEYPFMALLTATSLCGGTLVHPSLILTAAHCRGAFGRVQIGIHDRNDNPNTFVTREAVAAFIHPDYDGFVQNDIALVWLDQPVTSIDPVPYARGPASSIPTIGSDLTVTGFGRSCDFGQACSNQETTLQEANVPAINPLNCARIYGVYNNNLMFCASNPATDESSCSGDSGGPALENGIQVGIVSFGSQDSCVNGPKGFTRVARYTAWIDSIIDRVENDGESEDEGISSSGCFSLFCK